MPSADQKRYLLVWKRDRCRIVGEWMYTTAIAKMSMLKGCSDIAARKPLCSTFDELTGASCFVLPVARKAGFIACWSRVGLPLIRELFKMVGAAYSAECDLDARSRCR